jgi:hypothetical protein
MKNANRLRAGGTNAFLFAGAFALATGITDIVRAFQLRKLGSS